jgi:hypothetical protein
MASDSQSMEINLVSMPIIHSCGHPQTHWVDVDAQNIDAFIACLKDKACDECWRSLPTLDDWYVTEQEFNLGVGNYPEK